MSKKIKLTIVLIIAIFFASFVCFHFISNVLKIVNVQVSNNEQNTKMKKSNIYLSNILAVGDSLAKGTGDESGKGFVQDFADMWKSDTKQTLKVNNVAINGDTSSGLINVIEDRQVSKTIKNSQIIFVSTGANDIRKFYLSSSSESLTGIKEVQDRYLKNLKLIFDCIRNNNSDCIIVFIGLYNPFDKNMPPYGVKLLDYWNYKTNQFISENHKCIFVPTYDIFKDNADKYLASDKFHPNAAGYRIIARRIFDKLKNYNVE